MVRTSANHSEPGNVDGRVMYCQTGGDFPLVLRRVRTRQLGWFEPAEPAQTTQNLPEPLRTSGVLDGRVM